MKVNVKEILVLMHEVEAADPIDWGMLAIDENAAMELIANNIVDQYNTQWQHLTDEQQILSLLATMGKLIVENFALNIKLRQ